MSRHYLWLSARSWIVLLFSTAVSFVAVSVGSGYVAQLAGGDKYMAEIRGGDFNYCRLSGVLCRGPLSLNSEVGRKQCL